MELFFEQKSRLNSANLKITNGTDIDLGECSTDEMRNQIIRALNKLGVVVRSHRNTNLSNESEEKKKIIEGFPIRCK